MCNKVPTDVPFHLIFNKSKQINTQQNDAEDREWHPIKEMISNGKVGALRQSSKGGTAFFSFSCCIRLDLWQGAFRFSVPSFQTVKDSQHESSRTAAAGSVEPAERFLHTRPETASEWKSVTCQERNVNVTLSSFYWDSFSASSCWTSRSQSPRPWTSPRTL